MSLEDDKVELSKEETALFKQHLGTDDKTKIKDHKLQLSKEELALFKQHLGTDDETEIKEHIVKVGSKAYEVRSSLYGHIVRGSQFLTTGVQLWITKSKFYDYLDPDRAYRSAVKLCAEREDGLFLDYGCCFGVDLRMAVTDGLPVQKAIGVDIHPEFWDLGHELFKSNQETFPATFLGGDALDLSFVSGREPCTEVLNTPLPDLKSLKSLTPLQGRISAIHVANVFHLFGQEKQLELARALSSLLSAKPGSVMFGSHAGQEVAGEYTNHRGETNFAHSPESWMEMWAQVFPAGSVKVGTKLIPIPGFEHFGITAALVWSCTVL
ncbi:hypothetical protein V5O48_003046 [Marasmius crinis-equi]|uniref:Methyltransferase domain-containing protein n=1 Tax=Marasmius crinis-equi TaxID=585013 RepID=A0ABR3FUF0_9AGAR